VEVGVLGAAGDVGFGAEANAFWGGATFLNLTSNTLFEQLAATLSSLILNLTKQFDQKIRNLTAEINSLNEKRNQTENSLQESHRWVSLAPIQILFGTFAAGIRSAPVRQLYLRQRDPCFCTPGSKLERPPRHSLATT
jgi:hypothetical protein